MRKTIFTGEPRNTMKVARRLIEKGELCAVVCQCTKNGQTLTVQMNGELDHHSAAAVKAEVDQVLKDTHISVLEFDFKKLRFMDSSGVGILIGRYKVMQKRGGVVRVKNVNAQIDKMMELSGLYKIIQQA